MSCSTYHYCSHLGWYDTLRVCRGQSGLMRGGGSHDPMGDAYDNVTGEEGRGILSR